MNIEKERKAFEQACCSEPNTSPFVELTAGRLPNGDYANDRLNRLWLGWLAAKRSLSVEAIRAAIDACRDKADTEDESYWTDIANQLRELVGEE